MRWLVPFFALLLTGIPARADFGLHLGTHMGFGKMGDNSQNGIYQKRSMGVFDIQAMPGLRFYGKSLLAGLLLDARLVAQFTGESIAEDGNSTGSFAGKGLTAGPGIVYEFGPAKVLFSWDWRARASIRQPDACLKGSGFHFLLGYKAAPTFTVDFEFVSTRYNAITLPEFEMGLGENAIRQKVFGFGVSLAY